ncbi:glycosyltransferase family 2 protein [Halomicronema sp. CCY15110]|uniref:glycosyltransferase family 2 protein n=1 Tax=Halomicronema sp. CCY15110 TaxID=2767773 RepID=UPI0019500058|nr:glycosyltransferase family 2 protein [Halomicronema sp. CCY15110]
MILETENLSSADVAGFSEAIASLLQQDIAVSSATEFIVIDTGELSNTLKQQLQKQYPWMSFLKAPMSLGYYEVKQLGAESASGEVVVYCDADCTYEADWLKSLLVPFEDPAVEIIAGETTIPVTGGYSMAMALNYMLHRQEPKPNLIPTGFYYINNVAFRRHVIIENPLPTDLKLYRGTCSVHSRILKKNGHQIWKQFAAEAQHAPPNGVRHYLWRFLVMGHDHYWLDRYFAELKHSSDRQFKKAKSQELSVMPQDSPKKERVPFSKKSLPTRATQKVQYILRQTRIYLQAEPELGQFLPLALPIILFSQGLIFIGRTITSRYPHALLRAYLKRFEPAYGDKVFSEQP